jgi:hypothetical protein
MFRAKLVLESDNGKEWTVGRIFYVTSDVNPETGRGFRFGKMEFVEQAESNLVEGNLLVKSSNEERLKHE